VRDLRVPPVPLMASRLCRSGSRGPCDAQRSHRGGTPRGGRRPCGSWPFSASGEARLTNGSPRRTAVATGLPCGRADASPRPAVASRSPGGRGDGGGDREGIPRRPSGLQGGPAKALGGRQVGNFPGPGLYLGVGGPCCALVRRTSLWRWPPGKGSAIVRYLFLGHPPGLRCFLSYSSTAASHSARSLSGIRCWFCSVTSSPVFSKA